MMLEAAIKPDARMRPFADFVKMAAFMLPTVSCVPYALDGNTLRPVTASKNHGDSFGRSLIGLVSRLDAPIRGPVPGAVWDPPEPVRRSWVIWLAGSSVSQSSCGLTPRP